MKKITSFLMMSAFFCSLNSTAQTEPAIDFTGAKSYVVQSHRGLWTSAKGANEVTKVGTPNPLDVTKQDLQFVFYKDKAKKQTFLVSVGSGKVLTLNDNHMKPVDLYIDQYNADFTAASPVEKLYYPSAKSFTDTYVPVNFMESTGGAKATYPWVMAFGKKQMNMGTGSGVTGWDDTADEGNMVKFVEAATDLTGFDEIVATSIAKFEDISNKVTSASAKFTPVKNVSELDNNSVYVFHNGRGYLGYSDTYKFEGAACQDRLVTFEHANPEFALLKSKNGNLYMYSVPAKKFVVSKGTGDQSMIGLSATEADIVSIEPNGNQFNVILKGVPFGISTYYKKQGGIIVYNQLNDDGNKFDLSKVSNPLAASTDFSEAIAVIDGIEAKQAEECAANVKVAEDLMAIQGLGYPLASARPALQSAIDLAKATPSYASNQALLKAIEAYKTTDQVEMPVVGKAYTFVNVTSDNKKSYLFWDGAKVAAATLEANVPMTGVFVCNKVGDQFVFVNNAGKYLTWQCDEAKHNFGDGTGFFNQYDEKSLWTLYPAANKKKNAAKMGYFLLEGAKKADPDGFNYLLHKFDSHTFHAGMRNQVFDDGNLSSYWKIEEAAYANQPEMKAIGANDLVKIGDATKVATFSAPFATVVPANVKAYYVSNIDNTYNVARLAEVEAGKAVPAYQGVILATASEMTNAVMIPATTEAVAEIMGNQLEGTAGASKTLAAGKGYILTAVGGVVGLYKNEAGDVPMNKAYLPIVENLGSSAMKLVFGDEVTGIEGVEAVENENAPIYDLSGRRVMNTVKGGIYIQNGKKFIVK